ncbi:uncharacterized protein LOC117342878 [Pecten maximus]|uniref:uncharacterized protein LOC117342878 n=1 Tax=Pecten maximus TaxID=6579 RepID=UPI0014589151|nr:uncharacterized protein LOC117342878 [Pecten maximus]
MWMCDVTSKTTLLLKLVLIIYMAGYGDTRCPDSNITGPLKYSSGMNNATFAEAGSQMLLDCCFTGYTSLVWSYRLTPNDTWEDIKVTNVYRLQENTRNQTLMIVPPDDSYPLKGYYRCIATNTQNDTLLHMVELNIADSLGRAHPRAFGPSADACATLGGTITVNCSADFGHLDNGQWNVQWFRFDNESKNISMLSNNAADSPTTQVINNGTTGFFTIQLVIHNVSTADINKTFRCYATSVRENTNEVFTFVIKLCPKVIQMTPVDKAKVNAYAGVVAAAVVVLILLVIVPCYLFKPQIHYKLMCLCEEHGGWRRLPTDPVIDFPYDTFISHSDVSKDSDLGLSLMKDLEEEHYNVVNETNEANERNCTINGVIEDLVKNSAALVVISPSDGSDQGYLARLDAILRLMESNRSNKCVTVIRHNAGGNEHNTKLKGLSHLTYEPKGNNTRRRKNFLCALKLRIRAAKKCGQMIMPQDKLDAPNAVVV